MPKKEDVIDDIVETIINIGSKYKVRISIFTVLFLVLNYLSYYVRFSFQGDIVNAINYLFDNPLYPLRAFPLSLNGMDLLFSSLLTAIVFFLYLDKQNNKKKYKKGKEHGSAKWGNPHKDLEKMIDHDNEFNNLLCSNNVKLVLDDKGYDFKYKRNKNMIVEGGSGQGKTYSIVEPNLLQMNADFVITDPKGTIINEVGFCLQNKGNYNIKIFNTINFDKSMKYNPLAYIKKEEDILKIVDTIIKNTSGNERGKEDFWIKAERLVYQAYLSVILAFFPKEEQHLGTLVDLIELSKTKEADENYKNAIDDMFDALEETNSAHFGVKQYKAFKLAAGETTKGILISCAARLSPLNIPSIRNLLSKDEMNLDTLGTQKRKTALFVIVPDTDETFNFLVAIMYTQLFNILCTNADENFKGKLPTHVRFMLDEFANIGMIPNFEKLIATIRSRNVSTILFLQTYSQLKGIYKEHAETIVGNCDTSIFLGGREDSTLKKLSETLGKETIDDYNTSTTRSQSDSYAQNHSKLGRELMTKDELAKMERDMCVVSITGLDPFFDKKYDFGDHPYFGLRADGDKNWFDVSKFLKQHNENVSMFSDIPGKEDVEKTSVFVQTIKKTNTNTISRVKIS